jgi:hypothetical protein
MFRLMNQQNATDYFLVFCTHQREHLEKMKDIFWEVDPVCGYTFSIFEHEQRQRRPHLFPPEPDYDVLKRQLLFDFCGITTSICALEEYILMETPFRRIGYKEHVLKPLELASHISITSTNPHRRPGEYTEGDLIHFL